jgi:hypothetical protein
VVHPSAQIAINTLIRLYDPRFPLSNVDSKPSDINVPFVHTGYSGQELTEEARTWLNFDREELRKDQTLVDSWLSVVDGYYQRAGRITETRFSTSFLASHTLADTILRGDWIVRSGEAILTLASEPPYYSLTIDEARNHLKQSQTRISNDPFEMIPLISIHINQRDQWRFTGSMLASVSGEWIQRYGLQWDCSNQLNLLFDGKLAQKLISWCDGFEVGYRRRKVIGQGNRLLLSKEFLEKLMRDYNLCLIVTTLAQRSAYGTSVSKESEVEFTAEREFVSIYRTSS